MIHVVLWKWRGRDFVDRDYAASHVNHLARSIVEHSGDDVRMVCVTDDPTGIQCDTFPLWTDCDQLMNASGDSLPSCYRRLKLYDPATQRAMGIDRGDRILGLDLDTLVTGHLGEVLRWQGRYVGWKLAGWNPHDEVYNGSFQMFTAGDLAHIWSEFDPDTSPIKAKLNGFRGSDQSWLSMNLIGRAGCTNIPYPVLASYPLHCKRLGYFSPKTRLVMFHGKVKPWHQEAAQETRWIHRYWREENALSE